MSSPVIIETAINGVTPATRNPHVPRSPEQIAQEALACLDAGASIIHNHIEDITLTGSAAAARYAEGWRPVLSARPDAILCPTLTLCPDPAEAVAHLAPCAAAGAIMAPLDPGSVNLCETGDDGLPGEQQFAYVNSFSAIAHCVDALAGAALGPSIAIYEPGFLRTVLAYHRAGRLPHGTLLKFYFAGEYDFLGTQPHQAQKTPALGFGLPPTKVALDAYLDLLGDTDLPWAVAILGGDCGKSDLARYALAKGGHLRVGLEDFGGPDTPHNVALVKQAVQLVRESGRNLATCAQARALLGACPPRQ